MEIKGLSTGSLNVCGLKTRTQYPDFCNPVRQYIILRFSETNLNELGFINIRDYTQSELKIEKKTTSPTRSED